MGIVKNFLNGKQKALENEILIKIHTLTLLKLGTSICQMIPSQSEKAKQGLGEDDWNSYLEYIKKLYTSKRKNQPNLKFG